MTESTLEFDIVETAARSVVVIFEPALTGSGIAKIAWSTGGLTHVPMGCLPTNHQTICPEGPVEIFLEGAPQFVQALPSCFHAVRLVHFL